RYSPPPTTPFPYTTLFRSIHDKLPEQAQWNTDADGFIAAGDFELTQATDFEGTVADFAADSYVSQYAVVGQELFINIGRDQDTRSEEHTSELQSRFDLVCR